MLKKATGNYMERNGHYIIRLNRYPDGTREQKWITTDIPTKRGNLNRVKALLDELRDEYAYETDPSKNKVLENRRMLVTDCLEQFYKSKLPNIQRATQKGYRSIMDRQLLPFFSKNQATMADLSPQMVQQLMNSLQEGRNSTTLQRYYAFLKQAFTWAIKQEILTTNPMDKIERPRKASFTAAFYTAEQVRTLISVAKSDPLYLVIVLSSYYGLRRSEATGLMWSSIDFEQNIIHIDHSVYQDGSEIIPRATLKTKSSNRVLPLIPEVRTILMETWEQRKRDKKLFGRSYNREYMEYVCVRRDGMLIAPDYVSAHFPLLLKNNNLPHIRFHDLRHSCATMLLQGGLALPQIQKWLGHSDINTTVNTYGHLDFAAKLPLADKMESLLGGDERDGDDAQSD